jgi:hypothetical protein
MFIAILSGGAGCIFVILAWKKKRREAVTGTWLPTQGVILSSTVKEHRAVNGVTEKAVYSPVVRYQYTLGSRTYTGMRITFTPIQYTRQKADQAANRYPPSTAVTIFYDPLHPEEAVLEQHSTDHQTLFSLGVLLAALGLGSMCITLLVFVVEKSIH